MTAERTSDYPAGWEADVVLRDGSTTHVRPILPTDAPALQAFHVGQSERSTFLRFFAALERLPAADLARFTTVDHADRVALVAVRPRAPLADADAPQGEGEPDEQILGVARYDRVGDDEAEVAFNIADEIQGRGLASVLLEHLAAAARERGIRRFTAEVLPQNGRMIAVFREAGYEVRQRLDDGFVAVSFAIDPSERSRAVQVDREHRAEALSMKGVLEPSGVVLVGDPHARTGSVRDLLARRVLASLGDGGAVHVVGVPGHAGAHPDVPALAQALAPDARVELAVLVADPARCLDLVAPLAALGTRALLVLSPGFAETGADGLALQGALVRAAHAHGMRLVGPASYGLMRATEERTLDATLHDGTVRPGGIGLFCQSAATAVAMLTSLERRGLGLSTFLSAGNRSDVSGNDVMQYWQQDDATSVVGLYLESIGNPRKFSRIARRLASVKPVVVVTAGRSGQLVPPGHAVRATKAPRRTLEEMLRQSGVVRVDNTHQLLDVVQVLALQPLPAGRRTGVVASSAALAAVVVEAADAAGLARGPAPVILPEDASEEVVRGRLRSLYADDQVDVVVAAQIPVVGGARGTVSRVLAEVAADAARTTVACVLGLHGVSEDLTSRTRADGTERDRPRTVPAYATPEDAVLALGRAASYATWRAADHGRAAEPVGVDVRAARSLARTWAPDGTSEDEELLDADRTALLLGAVGISVLESRAVRGVTEALEAAAELGYPVALKSTIPALRHRTDLGGVRLDVSDARELRADAEHVLALGARFHAGAETTGVDVEEPVDDTPLEVQTMAPAGVACVVRAVEDPLYGPVVSFGLAGDASDLLGDVAYGIPPLTDVDVAGIVRGVRASPRLFGYRGLAPADTDALEDLLARVAVLADEVPELAHLELNPVVVAETGLTVLGARARLAPADRHDGERRVLPTT